MNDSMDSIIEKTYTAADAMATKRKQPRKPSGRGGWRPGAGRKRELTDAARATTVLDRSDFDRLEAIGCVAILETELRNARL